MGCLAWEQRFSGTFMEQLDLRYFPFDVQVRYQFSYTNHLMFCMVGL